MSDARVWQYRRWFEYEKDSHSKVLSSLETVPPSGRAEPSYLKALEIMGHIVAARQVWLFRFGAITERPSSLFPSGMSVAELREKLAIIEQSWDATYSDLTDLELDKKFEYTSLDGGKFRSTIEDILTQLFSHSSYHRGQIASLVRAAGGQPAVTDFVYWSRETIA